MQEKTGYRLLRLMAAALFGGVLGGAAAQAAVAAEVDPYDGNWHYDLAVYGWFPGITGKLNYNLPPDALIPSGSATASVEPSNYLSHLQFAAMLTGEARHGDIAFLTDVVYADVSNGQSTINHVDIGGGRVSLPLNQNVNIGMRALIVTGAATYTVLRNPTGTLDLLGGVRYAGIHDSLDWNFSGPNGVLSRSGSTSQTVNLVDGIVGVHGGLRLSADGTWFMPYEADIGAGNYGNWTWQAYLGVGYKFDWGDVIAGFRNISYYAGSDNPVERLSLTGPLLAAKWSW